MDKIERKYLIKMLSQECNALKRSLKEENFDFKVVLSIKNRLDGFFFNLQQAEIDK